MFFIDNDQSQIGKRCKQCRSGSHHHLHLATFRSFELVITFSLGKSGIQDRNFISKHGIKTPDCLIGKCNFRNQHNGLFSLFQYFLDQPHVNLRLSASGHSKKKCRSRFRFLPFLKNLCNGFLLFLIQRKFPVLFYQSTVFRNAVHFLAFNLYKALFFKKIQDRNTGSKLF